MSAALSKRIAALEAKRLKEDGPRIIYVIGSRFPRHGPDTICPKTGMTQFNPYFTNASYEAFARAQQNDLMQRLAEIAKRLDAEDDTQAESPPIVGTATERAPLKPGAKTKRFVFTTERSREIEIDTLTGKSRFT